MTYANGCVTKPENKNVWLLMEVSINRGTPKWTVHKGKSHLEMDDEQGYPYLRKPYIYNVYDL